jgi:hypothetical protein
MKMADVKFDSADRAAIATMNRWMFDALQRAKRQQDREDRKIANQFARAMNAALLERQRELARARKVALQEIGSLMRKHSLTVEEVMA